MNFPLDERVYSIYTISSLLFGLNENFLSLSVGRSHDDIIVIPKNVNVKIPITNTKGIKTSNLISELTSNKILCNVTAIFTVSQIKDVLKNIKKNDHIILSIFAGRIADSGIDPEAMLKQCKKLLKNYKNAKLLWASTREIFSIIQAERCGCDIITVPENFIKNLNIIGKNLNQYSQETVKMFYSDSKKAGYDI